MCLMSFIFYLFSLYYYFFRRSFSWCALVLSLISAHYRISSRLILNVVVIIKRAAVEVQLVFVPGLWTGSTTNRILSAPLPGPDRCFYDTKVLGNPLYCFVFVCLVFFGLLGQVWLGLFSHFQSFLACFFQAFLKGLERAAPPVEQVVGIACCWADLADLWLKLAFCQVINS